MNISLTSAGDKLFSTIPSLLHEQLSKRLKKLTNEELIRVEESLDTLVNLLDIEQIEASPLITMESDLEDIEENPEGLE